MKFLVESLSHTVVALATKRIEQGRLSKCVVTYILSMTQCTIEKFANKLLGKSKVEDTLQKLDRLTQDQVRRIVAQTLGFVHGLVDQVQVVMERYDCFGCLYAEIFLSTRSMRWWCVDG